jgi:thiol-disulfide isomerase/thioredoxin
MGHTFKRTTFSVWFLAVFAISQMGFTSAPKSEYQVVVFLASKCTICRYYALPLRQLHDEFAPQGIEFQGVFPNARSTRQQIREFKAKYEIPFELGLDFESKAKSLNAAVTPEVFVLDQNDQVLYSGRIDNSYFGVGKKRTITTKNELHDALTALVNGQEIPNEHEPAVGCLIEKSRP